MISEQAGTQFFYGRLLTRGRITEGRFVRNLLLLYRGQYGNLLASLLFFVIPHHGLWSLFIDIIYRRL